LPYYTFLNPTDFVEHDGRPNFVLSLTIMSLLSMFSPFAGLLEDVVYGRFKVLRFSTYVMAACNIFCLFFWTAMIKVDSKLNSKYYLYIIYWLMLAGYYAARVVFVANVNQFGTDQLRDAPTHYSVTFIELLLWFDSLTVTMGSIFTSLPHYDTVLKPHFQKIESDSTKVILFEVSLSISILMSIAILYIVQRHPMFFNTEGVRGNPYRLVLGVIKFAIQHKQPLMRSSFTYCIDERPTRMDYAKQIYGGPFTTEEVEDVKVLLNIVKVIISVGPTFLLEYMAVTLTNPIWKSGVSLGKNSYTYLLLKKKMLMPLVMVIVIPVFIAIIRPNFHKWMPNMFKRIGISHALLIIIFILFILYNSLAKHGNTNIALFCTQNITHDLQLDLVEIPFIALSATQTVLNSFIRLLIFSASWEFICSQSPQQMKGMLFGVFYATKALFELLAIILSHFLPLGVKSKTFYCLSGYYFCCLVFCIASLLNFTYVARKYSYRKRDDICNVYQFAEDYYSKGP